MLRCTQCGSEGEFEVSERVDQLILVQVDSSIPNGYHFKEVLETYDHDWGYVRCRECKQDMNFYQASDAYEEAHVDTPIPYTLVDASVS